MSILSENDQDLFTGVNDTIADILMKTGFNEILF